MRTAHSRLATTGEAMPVRAAVALPGRAYHTCTTCSVVYWSLHSVFILIMFASRAIGMMPWTQL
jgi:hypothetical protein